jgi:hypothetical protein
MQKIIHFLKNNWTLRTVFALTIVYISSVAIFEQRFSISEVLITFFAALYVVWGFMTPPKKSK